MESHGKWLKIVFPRTTKQYNTGNEWSFYCIWKQLLDFRSWKTSKKSWKGPVKSWNFIRSKWNSVRSKEYKPSIVDCHCMTYICQIAAPIFIQVGCCYFLQESRQYDVESFECWMLLKIKHELLFSILFINLITLGGWMSH